MPDSGQPSLSPGRLLYLCYHRPRTWLQDRRDAAAGRRGDAAMRAAAATLAPADLPDRGLAGVPCRFLTGERFLHQTIFCARSLEWACGARLRLEIFGDGTLRPADVAALQRALPRARVVGETETAERLDRVLPADRFPLLRGLRARQPLMRKLVDLHAGLAGPALYLDSDMLFFRPPEVLRDWLRQPDGTWFMQQEGDALVDTRTRLETTFDCALLPGVNSGIVATHDELFDWAALEAAAGRLTAEQRAHAWAEQTLFAWQLSRYGGTPLSRRDYFLCHGRSDLGANPPVLRHYVHKAKALYAAAEWQRWLDRSRIPATAD